MASIIEQFTPVPYPRTPMNGKTVIVTGSNTGLGFEAAKHLCRLNCAVLIIAVRNLEKGEAAKKKIITELNCKTEIQVWELDQASFASVKAFGERAGELPNLDGVILNAACATRRFEKTVDGWENSIQVNVLSTAYLALLLLPKLRASQQSSGQLKPHLTVVTSEVHTWTPINERKQVNILEALNDASQHVPKDRYPITKLLDIYITESLAKYINDNYDGDVVVNCVNPGLCHSELARENDTWSFWLMKLLLARSTESGSRTLVHGLSATGSETMGKYLSTCKIKSTDPKVTGEEGEATRVRVWKEIGDVLEKYNPEMKQYF